MLALSSPQTNLAKLVHESNIHVSFWILYMRKSRLLKALPILALIIIGTWCFIISSVHQARTRQEQRQELYEAIHRNDLQRVRVLLQHGLDPNSRLHMSVKRSEQLWPVLLGLIGLGPLKNTEGMTAGMMAVELRRYAILKLLLDHGADPNLSSVGTPLLTQTVSMDEEASANLLLAHGASVNATDKVGWTALMYAVDFGDEQEVKVLLAHHANILIKNPAGNTALSIARAKHNRKINTMLEKAMNLYQ